MNIDGWEAKGGRFIKRCFGSVWAISNNQILRDEEILVDIRQHVQILVWCLGGKTDIDLKPVPTACNSLMPLCSHSPMWNDGTKQHLKGWFGD